MEKAIQQVIAFHVAGRVPASNVVWFPDRQRQRLRLTLINEEFRELLDAHDKQDMVEVADGIADMIYVLVGMALEYGIPLAAIWNEVHRSNMTKFLDVEVEVREDGKILKGPYFQPPRIREILETIQTHLPQHQSDDPAHKRT